MLPEWLEKMMKFSSYLMGGHMNIGKHFLVVLCWKNDRTSGKKGTVAYKDASGNFDVDFKLGGTFEDESYGFFSGNWLEDGENYKFEILLEPEEKELSISQQDKQIVEFEKAIPIEDF